MLPVIRIVAFYVCFFSLCAFTSAGKVDKTDQPEKKPERAEKPETVTNSIGMKFCKIPAGEFLMGRTLSAAELVTLFPDTEKFYYRNEVPQHRVTISKPFFMGMTEVTQAQWNAVMRTQQLRISPDAAGDDDIPVTNIVWDQAVEFCKRLSEKDGERDYRLPTEAEWEYAARAGSQNLFSFGDDIKELNKHAWFIKNWHDRNHRSLPRTCQKLPNRFGLYDMHGGVFEWCADEYLPYSKADAVDPGLGVTPRGGGRCFRGGSWAHGASSCRSSSRGSWHKSFKGSHIGFRVVTQKASDQE